MGIVAAAGATAITRCQVAKVVHSVGPYELTSSLENASRSTHALMRAASMGSPPKKTQRNESKRLSCCSDRSSTKP